MGYYKYYVYTLAYPDGRVFYVGKGQGDRIHEHELEARRSYLPQVSAKVRVIREIWASGGKVVKTKVFETDNEQEANEHEQQVIAQCDKRYLTNQTRGGGPQFSKRDPYARLKSHRQFYYSPAEAIKALGVSVTVWRRLTLAGVVQFYTVEGCSWPVLHRKDIDDLAARIQAGTYPIDVWEDSIQKEQLPLWSDPSSSEQTGAEHRMSRTEMLREAATFALQAAQQAFSMSCHPIGSYEGETQQHEQHEPFWEVHIRVGQEKYIYTVELQQYQFVISDVKHINSTSRY